MRFHAFTSETTSETGVRCSSVSFRNLHNNKKDIYRVIEKLSMSLISWRSH